MLAELTPMLTNVDTNILCYYTNNTEFIQKVKINCADQFIFEKIVFPHQRILFEAPAYATLEIYANNMTGKGILCEEIPCCNLQIKE
jgi:hypothetical protein